MTKYITPKLNKMLNELDKLQREQHITVVKN